MTTILVELSEDLKSFVEAQAAEGGYASTNDYLQAIIRADQRTKTRRTLEAKLDEALASGPSQPMTPEEWVAIEREAIDGLRGESIRP